MPDIAAEQLVTGEWRHADCPPGLTDAWRQIHHAAQAASEVGKSWAQPRDDDSHSNFGWLNEPSQVGFRGVCTQTDPPFHARLSTRSLVLRLQTDDAAVREEMPLHGKALDEAREWVDAVAKRLGGPRHQPAVPAPDLPEHPVADGAAFDADETTAFEAVTSWYANAEAMLRKLRTYLADADTPRCWPHHLDHAVLSVERRDGEGAMAATIGVGITPPDSLEASGYWYVGPWATNAADSDDAWPKLPVGRWVDRKGTMPLAILPLTTVATSATSAEQEQVVASFVAAAVNTCRDNLP
jgi:hypothetical protein